MPDEWVLATRANGGQRRTACFQADPGNLAYQLGDDIVVNPKRPDVMSTAARMPLGEMLGFVETFVTPC